MRPRKKAVWILLTLMGLSPDFAKAYETDPGCIDLNRSRTSLFHALSREVNHCRKAEDCRYYAFQNLGFHAHKSELAKVMVYTQTATELQCAEGFAIGMPAQVPKAYLCEKALCVPQYSSKRGAMDTGPYDEEKPDWAKKFPQDYNLSAIKPDDKARFAGEAKTRLCEQAEKAMACGKKRGRVQKK